MKFKDFQAPVLFSSTFKALNLGEKNSSTFEYFQECVGSLPTVCSLCWWNNQFAGGRRLDMSARDKLAACAVQARWWSLDALYKYWLVPLVPKSTLKNYARSDRHTFSAMIEANNQYLFCYIMKKQQQIYIG